MSEDKDLLAQIARISGDDFPQETFESEADHLSGQINLHKTHIPIDRNQTSVSPASGDAITKSNRFAPYRRGRGRGGRIAPVAHRHRSLVLNQKSITKEPDSEASETGGENPQNAQTDGFVSKHDRHMQLINSSIYDKETQLRSKAMEETRRQKALHRDQRERQKIKRHFQGMIPISKFTDKASVPQEIMLEGLRFHVVNGGSKLARVRGMTLSC